MQRLLVTLGLLTLIANAAHAVVNPENGHEYILVISNVDRDYAEEQAAGYSTANRTCYLATLTSAQENALMVTEYNLFLPTTTMLGGTQLNPAASTASDWEWGTGEPFVFTNWSGGEPNDGEGDESNHAEGCLVMYEDGTWNDGDCASTEGGYIVECESIVAGTTAPLLSSWGLGALVMALLAIAGRPLLRNVETR